MEARRASRLKLALASLVASRFLAASSGQINEPFLGLKFNTGLICWFMLLRVNMRVIKITSDVAALKLGLLLSGRISAVIHSV